MPPRAAPPRSGQMNNILKYAAIAASTLSDISDSTDVPFLRTIATVTVSILTIVQTVKTNQDECMRMVARIEELLSVILRLCAPQNELSPATLRNVGSFTDTLQKIHAYVNLQQNTSVFKRFFRQSENAALLAECQAGLAHASDVFEIEARLVTAVEMAEMHDRAEKRHHDLLELVGCQREYEESDSASLVNKPVFEFRNSTTSFIMLPPNPQIFHGRDTELRALVQLLLQDSARVPILGPGGIGKTSLATAALHHADIDAKYSHRYFVSCESAATYDSLVSVIASYVGLTSSPNTSKRVLRHFSESEPSILLLDNFETSWEPLASRVQIEEFLSLLADIPHLALMITMRGAERPGSVRWTRPFLPPLAPLTDTAARLIFCDIADEDPESNTGFSELLDLTDNLPLAITLVANLATFEGHETLLLRWQTEKTTLFSGGFDKRSNLDLSIQLSLSSPRMLNCPGALPLLSLLSLLPEGISELDLLQIDIPMIQDMRRSKTTLIRTSVAYLDQGQRLRVLVPIREYIKIHNPPSPPLCRPLRRHFHELINLWNDYQHLSAAGIAQRLATNVGNLESVLKHGLDHEEPDLVETLHSAITFDSFCRFALKRLPPMMELLSRHLDRLDNHQLHGAYLTQLVRSWQYGLFFDPQTIETTAVQHFRAVGDIRGEGYFIYVIGSYYRSHDDDIQKALKYYRTAQKLAGACNDIKTQCFVSREAAECMWQLGQYHEALAEIQEMRRLAKHHGLFYHEAHAIRVELLCRVTLGDLKPCLSLSAEGRALLAFCGLQGSTLDLALVNSDAQVHSEMTEYAEAKALYSGTVVKHSPLAQAYDRVNLACIDLAMGQDAAEVRQELEAIKAAFQSIVNPQGITMCDALLAFVDIRDRCRVKEATLSLERLFYESRGNDQEILLICLNVLADIQWGLYDAWTTYGWALVLMGFALKGKNIIVIHNTLQYLGDVFVVMGNVSTAEALFQVALEGFTAMGIHQFRGNCGVRLGDLLKRRGEEAKALELWKMARPCFVRSSQAKDIKAVDERIKAFGKVVDGIAVKVLNEVVLV
ncbi:NB-ARC domain-containing protein [Favolaschia claudopus]|uniref:NB-ARC domain-containing protein n=1 Tax=Favolaschia claudopus TaxID=2862362 RepID=A0AAW0CJC9_9AGAR